MKTTFIKGVNSVEEVVGILKQAQSDLSTVVQSWETMGTKVDIKIEKDRLEKICHNCIIFLKQQEPETYGYLTNVTSVKFVAD